MLLLQSIRIAKRPLIWERAVHSVKFVRVYRKRSSSFVCVSFSFDFEGGIWGFYGGFLDHCLPFYIFNLDCGQNVAVPNGLVDFTNKLTTYGQSVPVTCDRGYNITEETHIECLANGTWSRTSGCEIIGNFFVYHGYWKY